MAKKPARKRAPPSSIGLADAVAPPKDRETVRIRRIDNGYITSREGVKKGRYFETEKFSPTDPLKPARAETKKPGKR